MNEERTSAAGTARPPAITRVEGMLSGETGLLLPRDREGEVSRFAPDDFDAAGTERKAPALVLFTSGSTGTPKGVGLSLDALTASAHETERLLFGPGRWHLCLPVNHIAGFQVVFRSLLAGSPPSTATPGGFDAHAFARDLSRLLAHAGSSPVYTSLVPTQLVRVLAVPQAAAAAARCAAVLLGGAALSPRLLERAHDAGVPVVRTYGMSETAGGCVYDGVPFPQVDVRFDAQGRVVLSGTVLADGYLTVSEPSRGPEEAWTGHPGPLLAAQPNSPAMAGQGAASRGAFEPGFYGEGPDRVLVTSDLGRWLRSDGGRGHEETGPGEGEDHSHADRRRAEGGRRIEILGRADDIIVTGGENVSPHEVEAHLLPVAEPLGFGEVLVSSVPDEEWGRVLVALLVPDEGRSGFPDPPLSLLDDSGLSALQDRLRARGLGQAMTPRAAAVVPSLPSRGIGKPDRRAAAELVRAWLRR